jgi:hypothetical protein
MVRPPRIVFLCGIVLGLGTFGLQARGAQSLTPASSPPPKATPHPPEHFAGVWAYNAIESVNAATGRPEQAPRSATQRTPTAARGGGAVISSTAQTQSVPGAYGFGNSPRDIGPTVAMIQENRSLRRDLMEVPEALTIRVSQAGVTFVDDLDRERTYQTNGQRQRVQLGAARFNAATVWSNSQLEKRIDAPDGFRMTEVYFLSSDAQRMFVIVRVGSDRKGAPIMGVNRVYDRVDQ